MCQLLLPWLDVRRVLCEGSTPIRLQTWIAMCGEDMSVLDMLAMFNVLDEGERQVIAANDI